MITNLKPIYLLADSQLLFWKVGNDLYIDHFHKLINRSPIKAAYIGVSNGDDPRFYQIFEAAMHNIGILDSSMICATFTSQERRRLIDADIILLSGGDAIKGATFFNSSGLKEILIEKYHAQALLIGISAGAMQLGCTILNSDENGNDQLVETLNLVPFIIGAHEEKENWYNLKRTMQIYQKGDRPGIGIGIGIGIPFGGGMIYYPDGNIAAIKNPLYEFKLNENQFNDHQISPLL